MEVGRLYLTFCDILELSETTFLCYIRDIMFCKTVFCRIIFPKFCVEFCREGIGGLKAGSIDDAAVSDKT